MKWVMIDLCKSRKYEISSMNMVGNL